MHCFKNSLNNLSPQEQAQDDPTQILRYGTWDGYQIGQQGDSNIAYNLFRSFCRCGHHVQVLVYQSFSDDNRWDDNNPGLCFTE